MRKPEKGNLFNLFASIISMFLVFSLISTTIAPHLVTGSLISSDLVSNPRYGITFPALETIEEMDEDAVIAIGSSIIRDAIDGKCITENLLEHNYKVCEDLIDTSLKINGFGHVKDKKIKQYENIWENLLLKITEIKIKKVS